MVFGLKSKDHANSTEQEDNAAQLQSDVEGLQNEMKESEKAGGRVHTFDPNEDPHSKKKAAAKSSGAPETPKKATDGAALDLDDDSDTAIDPTTTLDDAAKATTDAAELGDAKDDEISSATQEAESEGDFIPGKIPPWYKVGHKMALTALTTNLNDDVELNKLATRFFGRWYMNSGILILSMSLTIIIGKFNLGVGWVLLVLAAASTYYNTHMKRVKRNIKDDISRELSINRLESQRESAEWVNSFLDRFWLIYEPVLSAAIVSSADQVLSQNTPGFLDSIRMTQFTLGNKAPDIEYVKTWPSAGNDIIQMDWRVSFKPSDTSNITPNEAKKQVNPKVVLAVRIGVGLVGKALPILLEDMNFSGYMRIKFTLDKDFPFVQLVSVSFLERPKFDYVLKPIGGDTFGFDVGNIPGLSAFITGQVHANMGPMMYHPNAFTLNIQELLAGTPMDAAVGVLKVNINSAHNLSTSKFGGGKPDPYVSFTVGPKIGIDRTATIHNTSEPTWNETKYLLLTNLNDMLIMNVLDYNDHRKDSDMGLASFDLATLNEERVCGDKNAKLIFDDKVHGMLDYAVHFFPTLEATRDEEGNVIPPPDLPSGVVRVNIMQAQDLDSNSGKLRGQLRGQLSPFATLRVGKKEIHRTQTVKSTKNPTWGSNKEYLVKNKDKSMVTVEVFDDKGFNQSTSLGFVSVKLRDLLTAKERSIDWFSLSKVKSGRIKMAATFKPIDFDN
ncbi:hypothetical protein E3P86_02821 [Wallemia ichthyophaga]|uniref:Uncharacterized protein n=1 Tax=Wallemia ichthyophaga TaxID=245174 RepID=A0A4T0IW83_WALIC|nr:hypothetical protein E3P86_02821 [Wallemia ichthyophaga]